LLSSDNSSITGEPGADILLKAMIQPFLVLNENAGMNAQALFGDILANKGKAIDVNTGALVDPLKAGIIDPKRVTREAIQNAVSIAGTGMTMGALVVDVPEAKAAASMPDMSQMGM
jgi:chaperonin GroEL